MKLQIQANSVRLRVTQHEVSALADGERLEAWVQFAPSTANWLGYAIDTSPDCSEVRASYTNGLVLVTLPSAQALAWARTDQVGIEQTQAVAGGLGLKITIEKDLRCRHPRPGEDESDQFPNLL